MKKIILIIILFISLRSLSQVYDTAYLSSPFKTSSKYLSFLLNPNRNTQATLISASWQYLYIPKSKMFTTVGMHLNIGLNLARFFTDKFILGVCYDLKQLPSFKKQHFSQEFIDDFNSGFIPSYSNGIDSARAYTLKGAINHEQGFGVIGNTFENIGISFSPFPQKYGGIMIQVKKGDRVFPFWGIYTEKLFSHGDGSDLILTLQKCYSYEVSFKPYKFFNQTRTKFFEQKPKDVYKFMIITLYYERITLKDATFNEVPSKRPLGQDVPLSEMVNQNFLSKYNSDSRFGIKLGLAIY